MKFVTRFNPGLESLDRRTLPSIALSGGVLTITGTDAADVIRVTSVSGTQLQATVDTTGESQTFDLAQVSRIEVQAQGGDDTVTIDPTVTVPVLIRGGQGNDTLTGGAGDDTIRGGAGNDTVTGKAGNDLLYGGEGNDALFGRAGNDRATGGNGDDSFDGGAGVDVFEGGAGNNTAVNAFAQDDLDLEAHLAPVNGGSGEGEADFEFETDDGEFEQDFDLDVEDLNIDGPAGVFIDGVFVGTINVDDGEGELEVERSGDADANGFVTLPAGFAEVHEGSVISVQAGSATTLTTPILQGTFEND